MTIQDLSAFLLDTYHQLDAIAERYVRETTAQHGVTESCAGCRTAGCCHMLTTISVPEGLVLAHAVMQRPDWRTLLPRLRATALVDSAPGVTKRSRVLAATPCGLLDPATRECVAYDARPGCCRFHVVVTPREQCTIGNPDSPVASLNMIDIETGLWEILARIGESIGASPTDQAPVSLMVLACLLVLTNGTADFALVDNAAHGLPSPTEWVRDHIEDLHMEVEAENETAHESMREHNNQLVQIGRRIYGANGEG